MKISRLGLALGLGLSAASLCVPTAHAQSLGLGGILGGLGNTTYLCRFSTSDAVPPRQMEGNLSHVKSPGYEREPLYELVRFSADSRGSVTTGDAEIQYLEGCRLPITGGSLPAGTATETTLTLVLNIGGINSEQGDMACMALLGGQSSLTETFDIQRATGGIQLIAVGEENFNPKPGNVALVPVQGECTRQ
ncbi:MAG TPA: hypothetical protein VMA09_15755 [Candidatus Binataceae bacterium]|nr:hypothetical protein [Candidatus Binataceae bacterium]